VESIGEGAETGWSRGELGSCAGAAIPFLCVFGDSGTVCDGVGFGDSNGIGEGETGCVGGKPRIGGGSLAPFLGGVGDSGALGDGPTFRCPARLRGLVGLGDSGEIGDGTEFGDGVAFGDWGDVGGGTEFGRRAGNMNVYKCLVF
jgi:hypothetical protein